MTTLSIRGLTKHFGSKPRATAVDHLDLDVAAGEFVVLLGPSGCGKTTTLRCIAGLESADEGSVAFGGRTVFDAAAKVDIPPNKRNLGMVFQSYALWPHMTVRKNIGYPLRARRIDRTRSATSVEEAAALVDCSDLLDRYPATLSGGQQQRVALARGIVGLPSVILFDEPLSNLDARLRDDVRSEIDELHVRLGFSAIYVTHDQREAFALGDRLAIMESGRLAQLGPPQEVYERPASEYVAGFIGMSNRLELNRRDGRWTHAGTPVLGPIDVLAAGEASVVICARPEDAEIMPLERKVPDSFVTVPATVVTTEFAGRWSDVTVATGGVRLQGRILSGDRGAWRTGLAAGQPVRVVMDADRTNAFTPSGRPIKASPRLSV